VAHRNDPAVEIHPLSAAELRWLLEPRPGPLVSLFVPLESEDRAQNPLRVRSAVRQALGELEARNLEGRALRERRDRLGSLVERRELLEQPAPGIAAFDHGTGTRVVRLPFPPPERVVVADTFEVRPVIRELSHVARFRVLAVSPRRVALYEGDPAGLREVPRDPIPGSLEEVVGGDYVEDTLNFHSTHAGGRDPVYHSHGSAKEGRALDLERFHRALVAGCERRLAVDPLPTVVAGDGTHLAALRASRRLQEILREGISGNPDLLAPHELHARAWPLVEKALRAREDELLASFERAFKVDKARVGIAPVAEAVVMGRVRRLFLVRDLRVPGDFDPVTGEARPGEGGSPDLLDDMAEAVLRRGGEVIILEPGRLPVDAPVAAELF